STPQPLAALLNGTVRSQRPFAPPQRLPPLDGLHSGINVSGLLLRFRARSFHYPFGPSARQPETGSPRLRPLPCFKPVAVSATGPCSRSPDPHSPLGFLGPSGSKRSTGSAATRPAFRIRPISGRSPQPFLLLDAGCGSSFAVRYVSGGLLFLKPLGT